MDKNFKLLTTSDLVLINNFYKKIRVLISQQGILGCLKKLIFIKFGLVINKASGRGEFYLVFTNLHKSSQSKASLTINLNDAENERENRIALLAIFLKLKKIKFTFDNLYSYNQKNLRLLKKYIDQIHPEALILTSICIGIGLDIGCGHRKTHPDAIGVDWIAKGQKGRAGNVRGEISEADLKAKGDNLKMFNNNSQDYLVSRHNLEHYHNPQKTLQEWVRVVKRGGFLGIVVPNSSNPQTSERTHYFNFTLKNLQELFDKNNKLRIIKIGDCLPNWSFYCIAQKI